MRDSPQPLIHLEAAIVQMATLEPGDTLAELLARLESLEKRLGGAAATPASGPARSAASAQSHPSAPARPAPMSGGVAPRPAGPARGAAPPPTPARPMVASPRPAPAAATGDPAPETPARSATTALLERDEETDACWREAIAGTNRTKRMLGAFLEESRFIGLAEGRVVVAMDDLHRAVVEEKENRAILVAEIARAFGKPLELRCAPLAEAGLAPPTPTDYRPLIDQAIAWFQGDPIERPTPKSERAN